jgi:membrane dipeptidase
MKPAVVALIAIPFAIVSMSTNADPTSPDPELLERARRILSEAPLIDGHNDVPWTFKDKAANRLDGIDLGSDTKQGEIPMHTDIPRLRRGKVGAQFWSVYVPTTYQGPDAVRQVLEQIDVVQRMTARYSQDLEMAYTADDIERIFHAGRIASLIGMEGGHSIGDSLAVLRQTYLAGARYMTLTHSDHTNWADSATQPPRHNGLTELGREVVREMNRLGMLVDLSHVSPKTMHDALDVTEAPVIFSHSSARAVASHPRNVPDDVLLRVRENGGVVMVTFVPPFLSDAAWNWYAAREGAKKALEVLHPEEPDAAEKALTDWKAANPAPATSITDVANHIDHMRKVAGVDHIGIGSDFDGISTTPVDLTGVEDFPALFAELLRRGYSDEDLKKIAGGNVLRVMREVEAVAAKLQVSRPPSEGPREDAGSKN